jgi:hypothetical protein
LTTPNTYYSGLIAGEERKLTGGSNDALISTSPLPLGTALRNRFLSLTHGALSGSGTSGISEMFRIDQVAFSNSQYYVCFTNDHMLEITNGTSSAEQMAPLRRFTTSNSFEIALTAFAGQISKISDISIPPGGTSGPIAFTFGNLGSTSASALQVTTASSNPTLIPNNNLIIGGSGASRTITVNPVAGQAGSSVITVSATDGVWTNSRSFKVLVPTSPRITSFAFSGGNLFISGSNGVPNGLYDVLVSPNPALSLANWGRIAILSFDSTGNFSFSVPVDSAKPQQYYLIRLGQ